MAIDGLDSLVNNFEANSNVYNNNVDQIINNLANYVEDKRLEEFLDNYIEKDPFFNEDTSSMTISDKENIAQNIARNIHDGEIQRGETEEVTVESNGKKVKKSVPKDEVKKFNEEVSKIKKDVEERKEKFFKNKVSAAKSIQEYQASKISNVENTLEEVKKELEARKLKLKEIDEKIDKINNNQSEFDEKIKQVDIEISDIKIKISENNIRLEEIKKEDPDNYLNNLEYIDLINENAELNNDMQNKESEKNNIDIEKARRLGDLNIEKSKLDLDKYNNIYNSLSKKIKEEKEKYNENSKKLEEKFNELGIKPEEMVELEPNSEELNQNENEEQKNNSKDDKSKNGSAVGNTIQSPNNLTQDENQALVLVTSKRQKALNKVSQYVNNPDTLLRIDRLSNTDDYENLMSAIDDMGITDYIQRKELKNALNENTQIMQSKLNQNSSQNVIDMLENILGKNLSDSQKNMCIRMFNVEKNDKGQVVNILSGTNKFSTSDLNEIKNVIIDINKSDLTETQRKEFEDNFLNYVKMGSLNSQVAKNFASRFIYNKIPSKNARSQRQLEESINNYSKGKEKPVKSDSFFNSLRDNTTSDSKYASLDENYKSSRTKQVDPKTNVR